MLARFESTEKG